MSAPLIITDIDEQRNFWVRCTRTHKLTTGSAEVKEGNRYWVTDTWSDGDLSGPCTDHTNCEAGCVELAGVPKDPNELFCAADFEPIEGAEAEALMASMVRPLAPSLAPDIDAEIVHLLREAAKRATGGNCTFADDDIKILEHLATRTVTVAGEAYQVIGAIAAAAGLMEHPEVQRALDYFSGETFDGSILPFGAGPPNPHLALAGFLQRIWDQEESHEAFQEASGWGRPPSGDAQEGAYIEAFLAWAVREHGGDL
jgi:hypothetical protein